jgi:hypothetical protein
MHMHHFWYLGSAGVAAPPDASKQKKHVHRQTLPETTYANAGQ